MLHTTSFSYVLLRFIRPVTRIHQHLARRDGRERYRAHSGRRTLDEVHARRCGRYILEPRQGEHQHKDDRPGLERDKHRHRRRGARLRAHDKHDIFGIREINKTTKRPAAGKSPCRRSCYLKNISEK